MIIFTLILMIKSCYWIQEFDKINAYPTNGEYFEYFMSDLFVGDHLIYHYDPIIPNFQITNCINEITQIEGYEFISISSNQTHFATITKENHVILYEWKNFQFQQYGQIIIVEKRYRCYNIILFDDVDVLLDCYAEKHFYLLKLMNTSFNIVYSIQANKPISSKMQGIYNESKTFLIYAQYYQNISILTLFSSQFKNLTSYQNQFIEIGIPQRENPYIYILFEQSISQFIITQNYTFNETSQYSLQNKLVYFQVYYDYQVLSQCDQLLVQSQDYEYEDFTAYQIIGCQSGLFQINDMTYIAAKLTPLLQFFMNDQFVVFQSQNQITLYQQQYNEFTIGYITIDENTQIYFNPYSNQLQCKYIHLLIFTFDKQIMVYQLNIPSFQINLTDQQVQGNTYDITIYAQFINLTFNGNCKTLE